MDQDILKIMGFNCLISEIVDLDVFKDFMHHHWCHYSVFFPQFCDVGQVVIIHEYI
jgi:hypothetical protein